ncbi:PucR family transcriptional regulator [Mycolicibacterium frederiksbergense]|nr:PucR family transcriptional regulator [Mycolicibacterium frederiksbergense]
MVTVGNLLGARTLGLRAVHIDRADTDIRWVATSELRDPAPFLEGGEILLTTGMETRQWHAEWDDYVRRLADAAVAAVGLGIGLTHAKMPTELAAACRRHRVNLFEVPRQTTFVAVSRHVAQLLQEQESATAREAFKTQGRLIAAATKADPPAAVIAALAQAVDGAACLMAPDGRVISGPLGPRRADFPLEEIAADVRRMQSYGLRSAAGQSRPALSVSVHPIGLRGKPSTYLATMGSAQQSDGQRQAVTTAVAVLGLVDEQTRSRAISRRQVRTRVIELLVENDSRTAQLVMEVDSLAPALPARVRFLRASGSAADIDDGLAAMERRRALAAGYADELCAAVKPEQAQAAADELVAAGLQVGIGDAIALHDAANGYRTAGLALTQTTPAAMLVTWDRVVDHGPLALIDPQRAAAFAESWLRGLDSEQRETLRCFLRHHGSRLKVAEELGLHRNTVRNRLDAIEAMLPGRLDDPQTRVSAWIALQSLNE